MRFLTCSVIVLLVSINLKAQIWEVFDDFEDGKLNKTLWKLNDGEGGPAPTEGEGVITFPENEWSSIRVDGRKPAKIMGFRADLKDDDPVWIQMDLFDYTDAYSREHFGDPDVKLRAFIEVNGSVIQPRVEGQVVSEGTAMYVSWFGNTAASAPGYDDVAVLVYPDRVEFLKDGTVFETYDFETLAMDDFDEFQYWRTDPKVASSGIAHLDNAQVAAVPVAPRVSGIKIDGDNKTGSTFVPISFKATGSPIRYELSETADFSHVFERGNLGESPDGKSFTIESVEIADLPAVNGRKTLYLRVSNGVSTGVGKGTVALVLPLVTGVKVNGNNRAGSNQVPVSFSAKDAETYAIFWLDGDDRQVLAEGTTGSLMAANTAYTVADVDLSAVPIERGKRTIYVTCENEVGEAIRPGKASVTMDLPRVYSARVTEQSGLDVSLTVRATPGVDSYAVVDGNADVFATSSPSWIPIEDDKLVGKQLEFTADTTLLAEAGTHKVYVAVRNTDLGFISDLKSLTVRVDGPRVYNGKQIAINGLEATFAIRASASADEYAIVDGDETLGAGIAWQSISDTTAFGTQIQFEASVPLLPVTGNHTVYVAVRSTALNIQSDTKAIRSKLDGPRVYTAKLERMTGLDAVFSVAASGDVNEYAIGDGELDVETANWVEIGASVAADRQVFEALGTLDPVVGNHDVYLAVRNSGVGLASTPKKVRVPVKGPVLNRLKASGLDSLTATLELAYTGGATHYALMEGAWQTEAAEWHELPLAAAASSFDTEFVLGSFAGTHKVYAAVKNDALGGLVSAAKSTTVKVSGPGITRINPSAASFGTQITISGKAFGQTEGMLLVKDELATILSWTDTEIRCLVPLVAPGLADVVVIDVSDLESAPKSFLISPPWEGSWNGLWETDFDDGVLVAVLSTSGNDRFKLDLSPFGTIQGTYDGYAFEATGKISGEAYVFVAEYVSETHQIIGSLEILGDDGELYDFVLGATDFSTAGLMEGIYALVPDNLASATAWGVTPYIQEHIDLVSLKHKGEAVDLSYVGLNLKMKGASDGNAYVLTLEKGSFRQELAGFITGTDGFGITTAFSGQSIIDLGGNYNEVRRTFKGYLTDGSAGIPDGFTEWTADVDSIYDILSKIYAVDATVKGNRISLVTYATDGIGRYSGPIYGMSADRTGYFVATSGKSTIWGRITLSENGLTGHAEGAISFQEGQTVDVGSFTATLD